MLESKQREIDAYERTERLIAAVRINARAKERGEKPIITNFDIL
jgi:hypothetical protein